MRSYRPYISLTLGSFVALGLWGTLGRRLANLLCWRAFCRHTYLVVIWEASENPSIDEREMHSHLSSLGPLPLPSSMSCLCHRYRMMLACDPPLQSQDRLQAGPASHPKLFGVVSGGSRIDYQDSLFLSSAFFFAGCTTAAAKLISTDSHRI